MDERRLLRLDVPREEALARATALVNDAWRSFDRARPSEPPLDERVARLLDLGLPEQASPALEVLDDAAMVLDRSIAQPRPRYFAFVGSSGLEIGVMADLLAHCFDVNLATWAAAATQVERQAVQWAAAFVGYPAEAGSFTSGGTVSNVTALAAARERAIPGARRVGLAGHRGVVYCSADVHYSIRRAAELLGIGGENVRALPIDADRRLRPDALAVAVDDDRRAGISPVAVVATAGTTLTGAVDPIDAIADVCADRGVWLHVDGAYGLPAVAAPSTAALFAGLARADSVTLDAHKWLFLPKACSVLLVRRREDLRAALAHEEAYLLHERGDHHMVDITLEYSRPFRALKLWLAFRAHGAEAFREAIERNLGQARLLLAEIESRPGVELVGPPPPLSIVPFRHAPPGVADLDAHNARLVRALQEDGRVWIAPATIDGAVCLRPCIVNFRTSDDDVRALVEVTCEVGERLASS
ncbi:MAG: aminotransferase class V-fold PLP-dependent enzyme [Actinobacteria bacterium]|nr:aminotransferase class V-fold PLP-dependent enzyme [Actinomycetota bacterium]